MKQYIILVLCVQWNDTNYLRHSLSFYFHIQIHSMKYNRRVLGRQSACISFFNITFSHIWTSYKLNYSGIFKNLIRIVILVITFCDAVISHVVTSFLLFQLHFWYQEVFKKCCRKQNLEEIEEHTLRQSINLRATSKTCFVGIIMILYLLIMSRTRFRVSPHSIFAWISRRYLLEAGMKSEI